MNSKKLNGIIDSIYLIPIILEYIKNPLPPEQQDQAMVRFLNENGIGADDIAELDEVIDCWSITMRSSGI